MGIALEPPTDSESQSGSYSDCLALLGDMQVSPQSTLQMS